MTSTPKKTKKPKRHTALVRGLVCGLGFYTLSYLLFSC